MTTNHPAPEGIAAPTGPFDPCVGVERRRRGAGACAGCGWRDLGGRAKERRTVIQGIPKCTQVFGAHQLTDLLINPHTSQPFAQPRRNQLAGRAPRILNLERRALA